MSYNYYMVKIIIRNFLYGFQSILIYYSIHLNKNFSLNVHIHSTFMNIVVCIQNNIIHYNQQ